MGRALVNGARPFRVRLASFPLIASHMTTQHNTARALGIRYDGEMMDVLDTYTDTQCTLSTLAVPIGANLETVRAKLFAMRAKFADRAPIVKTP